MQKIDIFIQEQLAEVKQTLISSINNITVNTYSPVLVKDFIQPAINNVLEGKMIRPKMCILGALTINPDLLQTPVSLRNDLTQLCVAIELYHLSALIHDDIIDDTDLRRGKITAHKYLQDLHSKTRIPYDSIQNVLGENYGKNAALLLGDLIYATAQKHAQNITPHTVGQYREITQYFTQITQEVAIGQYYDLYASTTPISQNIDTNLIKEIITTKTAHYTITKPFILGTKLYENTKNTNLENQTLTFQNINNTSNKIADNTLETSTQQKHSITNNQIEQIAKALQYWGMAFQLKDDELNIFATEKETGKPAGNDLVESKHTLLLAYTLQKCSSDEKNYIITHIPTLKTKPQEEQTKTINEIKQIIINSGALHQHCEEIEKYYMRGKKILEQTSILEHTRNYLYALGKSLIERKN